MTAPVVIVGAGAAGLTMAEALRREGYSEAITLIGDEPHPPYDRPPLSKGFLLGQVGSEQLGLRDALAMESLEVELLLGHRAVGLDTERREVRLDSGAAIPYSTLVIATGVRPRLPDGIDDGTPVHAVRTIDDARNLAAALMIADSVAIVGGGLLGYELASTARALGVRTTMMDRADTPLARVLGPEVGALLAELHVEQGVVVRSSARVSRITRAGDGVAIVDRGHTDIVSLVIAATGSLPNVEWLEGSGLDVSDGVACDATGRAADAIYAIGDIARWADAAGPGARVEHRTNATDHAISVARRIVSRLDTLRPARYFWSDQFGIRIQVTGAVDATSRIEVIEGDLDAGRFVAIARSERGVGVIGWRMPREFAAHRARAGSGYLTA